MARESNDDRYQDATSATAGRAPWWLGGHEDCPHCDQHYAVEMQVHCVDCDAPICPLCVVRVEAHTRCPDCGAKKVS